MSENDIEIKVTVDAGDAEAKLASVENAVKNAGSAAAGVADGGFSKIQSSIVTLNSALGLAQTAFNVFSGAFNGAIDIVKRGSTVDDVAAAFGRLTEASGSSADTFVNQLQTAVGGTIPKFELMQKATEAMRVGMKPDEIIAMTDAARILADETGGELPAAMDTLEKSFATGRVAALKQMGIYVDISKAEAEYAKSIGTTADKLDAKGKVEAAQVAILEGLKKKTEEVGKVTNDAADNIDAMASSVANTKDQFALAVAQNESLNTALANLANLIVNADFTPLINGLIAVIAKSAEAANSLVTLGQYLGGQLSEFQNVISGEADSFDKALQSTFDTALEAIDKGSADAAKAAIKNFDAIGKRLKDMPQTPAILNMQKQLEDIRPTIQETAERFGLLAEQVTTTGIATDVVKPKLGNLAGALGGKPGSAGAGADDLTDALKGVNDKIAELTGTRKITALEQQLTDIIKRFKESSLSGDDAAKAIDALKQSYATSGPALKTFEDALDGANKAIDEAAKKAEEAKKEAADQSADLTWLQQIMGVTDSQSTDAANAFASGAQVALDEGMSMLNSYIMNNTAPTAEAMGTGIGASLGTGIGMYFGGAEGAMLGSQIGSMVGSWVGHWLKGSDSAGTVAKKAADKYFADIFESTRLSAVINGELVQIRDLVFSGETMFGGNVEIFRQGFADYFSSLPGTVQASFSGVGQAFAEILGSADTLGAQLGAVFANNIGGNLNALQLLVESTGKSFEELSKAIVDSFEKGQLSALEAQSALQGIAQVAEKGIPGALGAVDQAFENMVAAGSKGGRALIDAIQDIGYEAKELGITDLAGAERAIAATGRFSAEQIGTVFSSLREHGLGSVQALTSATKEQLIATLADLEAKGVLKETSKDIDEFVDKWDQMGDKEVNLKFNVETNLDDNTKKAMASRVYERAGVVPSPTATVPSTPGAADK